MLNSSLSASTRTLLSAATLLTASNAAFASYIGTTPDPFPSSYVAALANSNGGSIPFPDGVHTAPYLYVGGFMPQSSITVLGTTTATYDANLYGDLQPSGSLNLSSHFSSAYHYVVEYPEYTGPGTYPITLLEAAFEGSFDSQTLRVFALNQPTGHFTVDEITTGPDAGKYLVTPPLFSQLIVTCTVNGAPCENIDPPQFPINISHVSEPETLALLLPGVLTIGGFRRNRNAMH